MTAGRAPRGRYALNLSLCLSGLPAVDAIGFAARAGFDQVELWWPFTDSGPVEAQIAQLRAALLACDSQLVCLNIDAGDTNAGERGLLSDPGQVDRCRASIVAAVRTAEVTGCRLLNLPYGNRRPGHTPERQHRTARENLLFATAEARRAGASILIEPLNAGDNPGYLLPDLPRAAELIADLRHAGADNAGILLDVYHLARSREDVEAAIARHAPDTLHVQFADLPDRRSPGTGELDFNAVRRALADAGYRGLVGLEFIGGQDPYRAVALALDFVRRHPVPSYTE
ncbi:hydroxypyruvate isomerase family protein [Streptomyces sp. NPDC056835]|uniref:hydroxypyruvate isomerase family protein n=1 Tax=Streptomyces sp. NPDC056835 TaxID=3345956 RepID=UPI00368E62A3